jgi:hypothetical protein
MRFHSKAVDLREGSLVYLHLGVELLFGDAGVGWYSTYVKYRVVAIIVDANPCSFLEPESHRTYIIFLGSDVYYVNSDDLAEVYPVQDGPRAS